MYFWQGALAFFFGLVLPAWFGYAFMKRFGDLWGADLRAQLLRRSLKIVSNFLVFTGLPILVYYWMYRTHSGYSTSWLLLPLAVAWASMLAGAYGRFCGRKREEAAAARRRPGDWIQYRF